MTVCDRGFSPMLALLCAAVAACGTSPTRGGDGTRTTAAQPSQIVLSHALPQLDGGHLEVTIVEVTYGPGGGSSPHSHPCPVVGYVINGMLRTHVKGEIEAVYGPGESFYEDPHGVHLVSANASDREPVRFLAYFICDHRTPLSVPSSTELDEEDS